MAAGVSAIGKLADVCKGEQIQGQTRGCASSVKSPLRARREETGLTPSRPVESASRRGSGCPEWL